MKTERELFEKTKLLTALGAVVDEINSMTSEELSAALTKSENTIFAKTINELTSWSTNENQD